MDLPDWPIPDTSCWEDLVEYGDDTDGKFEGEL